MSNLTRKLEQWKTTEVQTHDIFYTFEQERRDWEPGYVLKDNPAPYQDEIDSCFSRAIGLSLALELPVGALIYALTEREKDIPHTAMKGLTLNIEDEERHFQVFQNIAKTYQVSPEDEHTANEYRKKIVQFSAHPLQKARDLETIIFLPLQSVLRFYGSQSLERTIALVSHDEFRHINYNWELSEQLNIGFHHEFESALLEIAQWMFEPLKNVSLPFKFWMDRTKELVQDGESELLKDLMGYSIHLAPFELSNNYY